MKVFVRLAWLLAVLPFGLAGAAADPDITAAFSQTSEHHDLAAPRMEDGWIVTRIEAQTAGEPVYSPAVWASLQ